MAGIKLLRENGVNPSQQHDDGVHNNVRHEHPTAAVPAKDINVDHARKIYIRALKRIIEGIYTRLRRKLYFPMDHVSVPDDDDQYPTFEQRDQVSFKECIHIHTIQ
jgi:hypothetical protein